MSPKPPTAAEIAHRIIHNVAQIQKGHKTEAQAKVYMRKVAALWKQTEALGLYDEVNRILDRTPDKS